MYSFGDREGVSDGATPVAQEPAQFIDSHPLDVVERRLNSLRDAVLAVEWEQERPVRPTFAATRSEWVRI
jgi:hypothetical protein